MLVEGGELSKILLKTFVKKSKPTKKDSSVGRTDLRSAVSPRWVPELDILSTTHAHEPPSILD